jgi:hypothetical protein
LCGLRVPEKEKEKANKEKEKEEENRKKGRRRRVLVYRWRQGVWEGEGQATTLHKKIILGKTVNYNFDSVKDKRVKEKGAIKSKDPSTICLINCLESDTNNNNNKKDAKQLVKERAKTVGEGDMSVPSWLLVQGGLFATARATPNKRTEV